MTDRLLHELLTLHPDLEKTYLNDATVYAWFSQYERGACSLDEAFIGITVHLAKEKKHYLDEVIKLKANSTEVPKV